MNENNNPDIKEIISKKAKATEIATETNPLIKPTNIEDPDSDVNADPDIRRNEEVKAAKHGNILFFHKAFTTLVITLIILIIIILFVLLPFSEMDNETEFRGFINFMLVYSSAFIESTSTIFITVATIVISDLLRRLYTYIKQNIKDDL